MKNFTLGLFFTLLIFKSFYGQRQLSWSDTINSQGNFPEYFGDYDGNMIKLDEFKNVYTAIMSDSSGFKMILISKIDSSGNLIWKTNYHSSITGNDWLTSIAIDDSNDILIGGAIGFTSGSSKFLVLKYNSGGQFLWSYTAPSALIGSSCNDIKFDSNGNIFACGNYSSTSTNSYHYNIIKLDAFGNLLSSYDFNGNTGNYGYPNHLAVDDSGFVYITAQSKNFLSNSDDGALIKLDNNLNQLWVQTYDGPLGGNDYFYDLELDYKGFPIVTGNQNQGPQNSSVLTVKFNSSGQIVWSDNFSVQYAINGTGRAITTDDQGNCFIGAETDSTNLFGYSILKYDSAGNLLMHNKFTPSSCLYSRVNDIIVLNNGNCIMFGYFSDGSISKGIITETSSSNLQIWATEISSNFGDAQICSGVSDSNDNIYVTGNIQGFSNKDLLVQKYSSSITLDNIQNLISDKIKIYPNPSTLFLNVEQSDTFKNVIVLNSLSQVVRQYNFVETKKATLNLQGLEDGIYFLIIDGKPYKFIHK